MAYHNEEVRGAVKDRVAGKPYVFELANRTGEDVERVMAMQKSEVEQQIDLSGFIGLP